MKIHLKWQNKSECNAYDDHDDAAQDEGEEEMFIYR